MRPHNFPLPNQPIDGLCIFFFDASLEFVPSLVRQGSLEDVCKERVLAVVIEEEAMLSGQVLGCSRKGLQVQCPIDDYQSSGCGNDYRCCGPIRRVHVSVPSTKSQEVKTFFIESARHLFAASGLSERAIIRVYAVDKRIVFRLSARTTPSSFSAALSR